MASQLTIPASVPGRFGPYGGRYVPETLMVPLLELERAYEQAKSDSAPRTLRCASSGATRDCATNIRSTRSLPGSVLAAHPCPTMVGDFHSCIGREARAQILAAEKRLPTHRMACVGGCPNAIGLFHEFLKDSEVKMIGIEAGGRGNALGEHAARLAAAQGFTGARPG